MAGSTALRFLGVSFGCCFVLLAGIAVFNWQTNPGGLFQREDLPGQRPEEVLGHLLGQGWNIATETSVDERQIRPAQILSLKPNQGTLVFGSSRVMEIRPEVLGSTGDFLSNWVGSANLEDDIALLGLHLEHGARPRKIVIGIDPWVFNGEGAGDPRTITLAPALVRQAARMNLPLDWAHVPSPAFSQSNGRAPSSDAESLDVKFRRYAQLISWGYLSQSLWSYFQPSAKGEKIVGWVRYVITRDDWNENRTYRFDGSMGYEKNYRERSVAEVEADAIKYAAPPVFDLEECTRVDPRRRTALNKFLDYLRASHIEADIYLPPYHPVTYALLMKLPVGEVIKEAEAAARDSAAWHGMRVIGSYDPAIAGCQDADFYDGMHLKKAAISRLFSGAAKR